MPRKKKELSFEDEMIAGLNEATERAKLEDLSLKFAPEEYNLPEPVKVREEIPDAEKALVAAGTRKNSKPRYVRGNRFYLYLGQKRVKGKWRGAVEHVRVTEEEKTVEVLTKVWENGELVKRYVNMDVRVRKESRPSKAFIERQKQKDEAKIETKKAA